MKKIKKIVCDVCGFDHAYLTVASDEGQITINKRGIVVFSYDSRIKIGDTIQKVISTVTIETYLGECPKCEDEAFVTIYFQDGSQTDEPEEAIKEMI